MKIPIYKPHLPKYSDVEAEIRDMYESGMLYPDKYTRRLEEQVKSHEEAEHVLAINSCSTGLILLLNLIPKGSKVIIPAFTFSATLQALEWNNLVPVVVDVDDNGQLSPSLVEECLKENPDITAIVPVHMWGNACHPLEFEAIRQEYNKTLFFDGAHVFGTTLDGVPLSQFGDGIVYSIAATKPVSAGEGGLLVTNKDWVFSGARDGACHGLYGSLNTRIKGLNGKIQEFNSILGYHAIKNFEQTKNRRAELMSFYRSYFKASPFRLWETEEGVSASYKDCVIFTYEKRSRDALERFLNSMGIGTKRYFDPAIPDMGSFSGIVHSADNARKLSETCLTLPLYPSLQDYELEHIIKQLDMFVRTEYDLS